MKKSEYKMPLHWLIITVLSFIVVYLFVFFGGWKLIESRDPIHLEIVVSVFIGFIIWIIFELSRYYDAKFKSSEKRIEALEERVKALEEEEHGERS